jgi:hypothetical protein
VFDTEDELSASKHAEDKKKLKYLFRKCVFCSFILYNDTLASCSIENYKEIKRNIHPLSFKF